MDEEVRSTASSAKILATRVGKVLSHDSNKGGFSTALLHEPDSAAEKQHGSLYFVIDVGSPSPLSADIAYNLIDIVKEEFYSDLELSAGESFENALKAANAELSAIAKEGEKDWMGKLNIVIAAVHARDMYVVQRGTAEIHLLRESNMINLSKGMYTPGETYRPEETLINLIEGEIEPGDQILLSTSELFYYISIEKLKRLIGDNTPAQAAKKLATMLEQEDDINRTSVLLTEFNTPEMLAQEEETEPSENWVGQPSDGKVSDRKQRTNLMTPAKTIQEAEEEADTPAPAATKPSVEEQLDKMEADMVIEEESAAKPRISRPSLSDLKSKINVSDYQSKIKINSDQLKGVGNVALKVLKVVGLFLLTIVDAVIAFTTKAVRAIKNRPGGNKILIGVVAALVIAVVGSTLALANGYSNRVSTNNAVAALEEAQQKRDAAQASLIYEDSVRARELLAEAYLLAESATNNTRTEEEAAALLVDLQSQIDEVSAVNRFTDVRALVDFDVLSAQLAASTTEEEAHVTIGNIVVLGGNIYTVDPTHNKIYKYKGANAELAIANSLVSTSNTFRLGSVASDSELIFLTDPSQVYSLNLVNNSLAKKDLDTGEWKNADQFTVYGERLYFLDAANNQIWKYSTVPEGYTEIASYFEVGTEVDLTNAIDFAIDGSVYVLMSDGTVKKYLGGVEVTEFALDSVPSPYPALGSLTNIYADAVGEKLYALDAINNRVVVFDAEGTYLSQYVYDVIENPQDLFVDETGGFIYLTSGTNVYRLPLAQ